MNLNKYQKGAFVRAVMTDIPSVDYQSQFQSLILKDAFEQLPPEIKSIASDPLLCAYLKTTYESIDRARCVGSVRVYNTQTDYEPTPEVKAEALRLHELYEAQRDLRRETEEKLEAAIASVKTLKKALELFPEFVKYLPTEAEPNKNVPMVTNLVADLHAAGWKQTA